MWLIIALLVPMFYAIANISDSFLINKSFKNPVTLIFYAYLFEIIFIPIVFLFYHPGFPPILLLPIFFLLGATNVLYLYPYYKGLKEDDTSTAVSFFGLGRIFIPIWAFLIVGERLSLVEYIGIIFIIIGSVLLSMKGSLKNIKFSKALFYILLAAFVTSFEGILLKYLFEHGVSVATGAAGEMIMSFLFVLLFLFHRGTRLNIVKDFSIFKQKIHLLFVEESATFIAFFTGSYALSIAPVSLVKSIGALTPFFILLYAKLFDKKLPQLFNEQKGVNINLKKIFLFSLTVIGIFLITR